MTERAPNARQVSARVLPPSGPQDAGSGQQPPWPSWLPADGSQGVPHWKPGTSDLCLWNAIVRCDCGWSDPDRERAGRELDGMISDLTRRWIVELPAGIKLLSLNGRYHWAQRDRLNQELKKAAWAMTLKARVPHLKRASVVCEYQPVPGKQAPDPDNISMSAKSCIDGIVAAGVLPDDSPEYVTDVTCRIGEPYPRGRLVLVITEVLAGGDQG